MASGRAMVGVAVWAVSVVFVAADAPIDWIPHDDGTMAHAAERVLGGEVPHRDFDEPYTGGLTLLHALAFRLLGVELSSLRWTLVAATALWVPAVFAVAARLLAPLPAALVTLTAVTWSVPVYPASLPSWYNLFLAGLVTWALVRFVETGRAGWTLLAGVFAGASLLVKLTGLYAVAAGSLFLVHHSQRSDTAPPGRPGPLAVLGVLACAAFVGRLVWPLPSAENLVHFLLPATALCALVLREEWRRGRETPVLLALAPFSIGWLLPVLAFASWLAFEGGLEPFIEGALVTPQRRYGLPGRLLPALTATLAPALVLAALLLAPTRLTGRARRVAAVGGAALGATLVALAGFDERAYRAIWLSVQLAAPATTVAGAVWLVGASGREMERSRRKTLVLLLAMAAFVPLVRFPHAFGIYFCYGAPAVLLAISALVASAPGGARPWHAGLLALYLAFAAIWLDRGWIRHIGVRYEPLRELAPLATPRGGIIVPKDQADAYRPLLEAIAGLTAPDSAIYATPDCPEVYFLSGRRNPTRTFFEIFDPDFAAPVERSRRILRLLDREDVPLVVLRHSFEVSGDPPTALREGLAGRYPESVELRRFTLRWRHVGE